MIINGKETNLKQFYNDYKPTQEEYETYRKVSVSYMLEDIDDVLFNEFDEATIDDLSDDELEEIVDRHENYVEENGYDYWSLRNIIRDVIEQFDNPNIEH